MRDRTFSANYDHVLEREPAENGVPGRILKHAAYLVGQTYPLADDIEALAEAAGALEPVEAAGKAKSAKSSAEDDAAAAAAKAGA